MVDRLLKSLKPSAPKQRLARDVERDSNLDLLLRGFHGIGNRLVDALNSIAAAMGDGGGNPDLANVPQRLEIVHGLIFDLTGKVKKMSSNIERIEKEAADAAENARLVKEAVGELKSVAEEMKAEITALKEQVAQGQIDQARLDAAAATFEKADDDTDAVLASLNPAPEPVPEG